MRQDPSLPCETSWLIWLGRSRLGANILLAHFHYCNKGMYPFSDECKDKDLRTLADLNDDEIQYVHATRHFAKRHRKCLTQPSARTGFPGLR